VQDAGLLDQECAQHVLVLVLSIPQHVSGVHHFPENEFFKKCQHEDLSGECNKPWLKPGWLSMKKLVAAIRLKDLEMMTEFQHTSMNENINTRHKSYAFEHPQAVVRACRTAIDHNQNADRKQKIDVDGDSQYGMVSTQDGLNYKERKVMEAKNTTWRKLILAEVLEVREKIIFFQPPLSYLMTKFLEKEQR
jgi:hypothetical protein